MTHPKSTDTQSPAEARVEECTVIVDSNHQLIVPRPPPEKIPLIQYVFFYGVLPIIAPLFLSYKCITDSIFRRNLSKVYSLVSSCTANPIMNNWYFQDTHLLKKLWALPSARAYVHEMTGEPHLEYQLREGYCASATQRCILRSLGFDTLPDQKRGGTEPEGWSKNAVQIVKESCHGECMSVEIETRVVWGDVSYEQFLDHLRAGLANENCRVACNFLRPGLIGFPGWRFLPMNFLLGIMGGHFSPILGILEESSLEDKKDNDCFPLVAIWDTNHKYNGAYFVPARRLYEAVHAVDLFAHKHRALVCVEKKNL